MTNQSDPNEFRAAVGTAFRFLVDEYGYLLRTVEPDLVEFVKEPLIIGVCFDPHCWMVSVDVRRGDTEDIFTFDDILKAMAPDECEKPRLGAWGEGAMQRCLDYYSLLLRRRCNGVLAMDQAVFEKLKTSKSKSSREYTLQCTYGPIIERANLAWQSMEWDEALRLYQESEPGLCATHKRRLAYLLRHATKCRRSVK